MDFKKEYDVVFTEECIEEINEIYKYISQNLIADKAAKELIQKVKQAVLRLSELPERHMLIDKKDKLKRSYRRLVINNFIVLYIVDKENKKVYISHMNYGRKNYL